MSQVQFEGEGTPTVMVIDMSEGGARKRIPVPDFDPAKHRSANAIPTVRVRDKRSGPRGATYVINASDFDAEKHIRDGEKDSGE